MPATVWPVLRAVSVLAFLGLGAALVMRPATGLLVLWTIVVPLLPLVFVVAPGLWRNVCPMAAVNQLPRVLGVGLARPLPRWLARYGYVIALALFIGIVFAREPLFNSNGTAGALLIGGMLGAALLGGLTLKGKGGWCNSICPLRPVQGLYGQTPAVRVENSHCKPCVGCTKNCPDLKPGTAHRDALRDGDHNRSRYPAVLAGLLPGLIVAYYTADPSATLGASALHYGALLLWSLGTFMVAEAFVKVSLERVVALYAAASLSLFYWFNVPVIVRGFGKLLEVSPPDAVVWVARENVVLLGVVFVVRTFAKDRAASVRPSRARSKAAAVADRGAPAVEAPETRNGRPAEELPGTPLPVIHHPERRRAARRMRNFTVTVLPARRTVEVRPGAALIDAAAELGLARTSPCGTGSCGMDPVFVVAGMESLSAPDDAERATLQRLELDGTARLACSARVQGDVAISLRAPANDAPAARPAEDAFAWQPEGNAAASGPA